jgi:hypothetical protein
MTYRPILFSCFLSVLVTASAAAQDPSGRIDLDIMAAWRRLFLPGEIVVTGVSFVESDFRCLEEHGTLRISGRRLVYLHIWTPPPTDPLAPRWSTTAIVNGDDTQGLRYLTPPYCQMEIAIRQHLRRDGAWVPLHRATRLPGVYADSPAPSPNKERTVAQKERDDTLRAIGDAGRLATFGGFTFGFGDSPEICVEAIGDYRVDRTGLQFTFFVPLPDELNRFVIERADPDANHGRLYFVHGDCRWELTVSMSVRRDGRWIALPVERNAPARQ